MPCSRCLDVAAREEEARKRCSSRVAESHEQKRYQELYAHREAQNDALIRRANEYEKKVEPIPNRNRTKQRERKLDASRASPLDLLLVHPSHPNTFLLRAGRRLLRGGSRVKDSESSDESGEGERGDQLKHLREVAFRRQAS